MIRNNNEPIKDEIIDSRDKLSIAADTTFRIDLVRTIESAIGIKKNVINIEHETPSKWQREFSSKTKNNPSTSKPSKASKTNLSKPLTPHSLTENVKAPISNIKIRDLPGQGTRPRNN